MPFRNQWFCSVEAPVHSYQPSCVIPTMYIKYCRLRHIIIFGIFTDRFRSIEILQFVNPIRLQTIICVRKRYWCRSKDLRISFSSAVRSCRGSSQCSIPCVGSGWSPIPSQPPNPVSQPWLDLSDLPAPPPPSKISVRQQVLEGFRCDVQYCN